MYVPSSELAPRPLSPQASVSPPPWDQRGDNTRLRVSGKGGANSDHRRESLALCLLCVASYENSMSSKNYWNYLNGTVSSSAGPLEGVCGDRGALVNLLICWESTGATLHFFLHATVS